VSRHRSAHLSVLPLVGAAPDAGEAGALEGVLQAARSHATGATQGPRLVAGLTS